MARSSALQLPGFPKFDSGVQEMNNTKEITPPDYEVCVALANGGLAVRENLIEYWSKDEHLFNAEAAHLLKEHNKKYNPKGIKRGVSEQGAAAGTTGEQPLKKVKVEASVKTADHESQMGDKCLRCLFNLFLLILDLWDLFGLTLTQDLQKQKYPLNTQVGSHLRHLPFDL